jgi:tetratricopeptide (TPR) repeat protein
VARKYYFKATKGEPYRVDNIESPDIGSLNKSIDYSKKLIANFPKSKWVDDAYLLWARGYLAKNDPLQTVSMLQDYGTRYPGSPLVGEANFYRGVALRQARQYTEAIAALDEFLAKSPKKDLIPYAQLERARAFKSLDRSEDAAKAAGLIVDRWPKSPLAVTARIARAEARFAQGAFDLARADYKFLGERSRSDDERLDYLLRETECLESGRHFDDALSLLRNALSHERPPDFPDTTGGRPLVVLQTPGYDRYGRLLNRIGTVELLAGHTDEALDAYRRAVHDYPRAPVSAEAQYNIGYAYEVGADNFDRARQEYSKVRDMGVNSPFVEQAQQRQTALDQLARFKSAGGDSSDQRVDAEFLLAEQYLFQLSKPDRALEEYQRIEHAHSGTPWAAKAINAQAWVLRRRLDKPDTADSLLWRVVKDYPATEAQLDARDYLEGEGKVVDTTLIQLPAPRAFTHRDSLRVDSLFVADSVRYALQQPLSSPPATMPPLGLRPGSGSPDSLGRSFPPRPGIGSPVAGAGNGTMPFGSPGNPPQTGSPGAVPFGPAGPPTPVPFGPAGPPASAGSPVAHEGASLPNGPAAPASSGRPTPAPPDTSHRRVVLDSFHPRGGKIQ